MEIAELKMVRLALGVTRKDKITNKYVRGTAKLAKLGDKLRNARLRWFGHVKRREEGYVGKRMMEMAVPGRRKRGRPRRRWVVCMYVLFIFILHSRESELYRYFLDGTSALAWELPLPRCLDHLSST